MGLTKGVVCHSSSLTLADVAQVQATSTTVPDDGPDRGQPDNSPESSHGGFGCFRCQRSIAGIGPITGQRAFACFGPVTRHRAVTADSTLARLGKLIRSGAGNFSQSDPGAACLI